VNYRDPGPIRPPLGPCPSRHRVNYIPPLSHAITGRANGSLQTARHTACTCGSRTSAEQGSRARPASKSATPATA